jgi:PAS domain S-box-containing protein
VADALELAIGIASALDELHGHELARERLVPGNLFVTEKPRAVRIDDGGGDRDSLRRAALPYMAPESTGRMNRPVDTASDLYSLGAILYELLTGAPPFHAEDPLEWAHCHIARVVRPPADVNPGVPRAVSDIVVKLLAKSPEERYATARGLHRDLETCLDQWRRTATIEPFELARHDVPDRLAMPQSLYGRGAELAELEAAVARVAAERRPGLVLLGGAPGIGKSVLVRELGARMARTRGVFLAGKFDAFRGDAPYAPFCAALADLAQRILASSEHALATWRRRVAAALHPNTNVLVDLVPELEPLLGRQQLALEVAPQEAQNRLLRVVRRFLGAITTDGVPVVLFLDDLQWADPASLRLLAGVVSHDESGALLVIAAHRSGEGEITPALRDFLSRIESTCAPTRIELSPLDRDGIVRLVSAALHCDPAAVAPLADVIAAKTAGNPFFVHQFLRSAHAHGGIRFDPATGWRWDLEHVRRAEATDNVLALLARRLHELPDAVQESLRVAACVGDVFGLGLLADVRRRSREEVQRHVDTAAAAGLLVREEAAGEDVHRWTHDRVRQAAYALVPPDEVARLHLAIGRALLAGAAGGAADSNPFAVVDHLNEASVLLTAPEERALVSRLDAEAGRRAKERAAFDSARSYFAAAIELLARDESGGERALAFDLRCQRAECELLCGAHDVAEALLGEAQHLAAGPLDAARVEHLRVPLCMHRRLPEDALRAGLEALRLLGIELPSSPSEWAERAARGVSDLRDRLRQSDVAALASAPLMTEPAHERAIEIMMDLGAVTVFLGAGHVNVLLNCKIVELSLAHGNTPGSAWGYAVFGINLVQHFGEYDLAYRLVDLAQRILEKLEARRFTARLYTLLSGFIDFTRAPLDAVVARARAGYEAGVETGDLTYSGYNLRNLSNALLSQGVELDRFEAALEREQRFHESVQDQTLLEMNQLHRRFVASLQGRAAAPGGLSGDGFDEEEFVARRIAGRADFTTNLYYYLRVQLDLLFERHEAALAAADAFTRIDFASRGTLLAAELPFYVGLALAGASPRGTEEEAAQHREHLAAAVAATATWAERCPATFRHRQLLLEAEVARLGGQMQRAAYLYDRAIAGARRGRMLRDEALANELAARCHAAAGLDSPARGYASAARAAYERWGGHAKVRQLEARFATLLRRGPAAEPPLRQRSLASELDALAVVTASQAISSEIVLDRLIATLLRVAIQQAGAEQGCLLLVDETGATVKARATAAAEVAIGEPSAGEAPAVPDAVVNYVRRTGQSLLASEPLADPRFAADPYLVRVRPRSVLCVPIVKQTQVLGVVYLEHRATPDAFTRERLVVLELLAAQAAISLRNAQLVGELERENRERRAAEEAMHAVEKRMQMFLEHTPILIWIGDEHGRLVRTSKALREMFHVRDEHAATTPFDYLPPDLAAELRRSIDLVLASGAPELATVEAPAPDGSVHTFMRCTFPMGEDRGRRLIGAAGIDITEQVRAQRDAEAARRRVAFLARASAVLATSLDYDTTLANVTRLPVPEMADGAGMYLLDEEGQIARTEVAHRDPDLAAEGRRWAHRYPASVDSDHPVAIAIRTGMAIHWHELEAPSLERSYGDPEFFAYLQRLDVRSLIIAPMLARGRVIGALVWTCCGPSGRRYGAEDVPLVQDVAERAALAIDNARLYRAAQDANRLKDEFLATLSHELRTPLNAILGWSNLMRDGALDEATQQHAIESIHRNAALQTSLISDLLDVSRIVSGKLAFEARPTRLDAVVLGAVDTARPAATAKGITIHLTLDDTVPPVEGDAARLQQVVWNLLSNAIKFTPRDGHVEVVLRRSGDDAEVQVRDTGEGISPEFLPHLFERFRQADSSSTRVHGGLGLGLSLVRHLVELHGGTVTASSAGRGRGATFTVRLPLSRIADKPMPPPAEAAPPAEVRLDDIRVLVVDDQADARDLIAFVLRRYGARVTTAASVAEGLAAFDRERPDVMLGDIEMPTENGYALIRAVRARPAHEGGGTPAAALTAHARPEDRERALAAGYQLHIAKPVDPQRLAAAVADLVSPRGPSRSGPDKGGTRHVNGSSFRPSRYRATAMWLPSRRRRRR